MSRRWPARPKNRSKTQRAPSTNRPKLPASAIRVVAELSRAVLQRPACPLAGGAGFLLERSRVAQRMVLITSSRLTGLTGKRSAPSSDKSRYSCGPPAALSTMIGVRSEGRARSRAVTAIPSVSGICRSSTPTAAGVRSKAATAWRPSATHSISAQGNSSPIAGSVSRPPTTCSHRAAKHGRIAACRDRNSGRRCRGLRVGHQRTQAGRCKNMRFRGLNIAKFAAREGLGPKRLYRWRERLGTARTAPAPTFVEVKAARQVRVEVVLRTGQVQSRTRRAPPWQAKTRNS